MANVVWELRVMGRVEVMHCSLVNHITAVPRFVVAELAHHDSVLILHATTLCLLQHNISQLWLLC